MAHRDRPRIDGASLVDPALHSPEIMEVISTELSRSFIEYVVDRVVDVVDYALGRPSTSTRGRPVARSATTYAEFSGFARTVIERAGVQLPVLLGTLVYLDRAKPHLQLSLEEWACERVFLGALICSNKYLNDSTLKNVHWSLCTGLFNKRDVGRIEREFLDVLDFELRISEADILVHHDAIMMLNHTRPRPHIRISQQLPTRVSIARRDSDASDSSLDTEDSSSPDSSSLPNTPPAVPMDLDHTAVRASSKHSPDDHVPPHTPHITSPPSRDTHKTGAHTRRGSAYNFLRNIHVPHFHSAPQ